MGEEGKEDQRLWKRAQHDREGCKTDETVTRRQKNDDYMNILFPSHRPSSASFGIRGERDRRRNLTKINHHNRGESLSCTLIIFHYIPLLLSYSSFVSSWFFLLIPPPDSSLSLSSLIFLLCHHHQRARHRVSQSLTHPSISLLLKGERIRFFFFSPSIM